MLNNVFWHHKDKLLIFTCQEGINLFLNNIFIAFTETQCFGKAKLIKKIYMYLITCKHGFYRLSLT